MDSNEFGEFIKVVRDKILSRPAMAEKTGLHVNTIKGYEQDGRLPDVDYLAQLAIETGHSFADLLNKRLLAGRLGKVAEDQHLMVMEKREGYDVSVSTVSATSKLPLLGTDSYLLLDNRLLPADADLVHLALIKEDDPEQYVMINCDDKGIQDGHSFVVDYGVGPVSRLIQFGLAGTIILVAEGKNSPPLTVQNSQRDLIKVIGKVVSKLTYL